MPLNNFGIVEKDHLYRCAEPDYYGSLHLAELGVDTILTLNGAAIPDFKGTHIIYNLPTFSVDLNLIRTIRDGIEARLSDGGVIAVHCTHGRDRTGLVIGAWRLRFEPGTSLEDVNFEREQYGVYGVVEMADSAINEALEELAKEGKA